MPPVIHFPRQLCRPDHHRPHPWSVPHANDNHAKRYRDRLRR